MELKLPFGMKDGKLVHVSDVEQGLKCGCVCPACGQPLVARKGETNIHHFAHLNEIECKGALETALHMKAKEIIEKYKTLRIPQVTVTSEADDKGTDYLLLHKAETIKCEKVHLEKRIDDFVPDIIIESGDRRYIVEFSVTHFIDHEKLSKIKKQNISVLEIDLSKFDRQITSDDLLTEIYEDTGNKKWIFNTERELVVTEFRKLHRKLKVYKKNSDLVVCPTKSQKKNKISYKNTLECNECNYLCGYEDSENELDDFLICAGYYREKYDELFCKFNLKFLKDLR